MDDRRHQPDEPGSPGGAVAQPHDALFRYVFGKPVHAASELRAVLPPQLADRLDLANLRPVNGSFVDEELTNRHCDVLMRTTLDGETPPHRLAWLATQIGPEAEEVYMSTADMLRAEGRAEGRAEHAAGVLLRLLTRKFGAVPDQARHRISAASIDQLDLWTERVLDATTLDQVLDR